MPAVCGDDLAARLRSALGAHRRNRAHVCDCAARGDYGRGCWVEVGAAPSHGLHVLVVAEADGRQSVFEALSETVSMDELTAALAGVQA